MPQGHETGGTKIQFTGQGKTDNSWMEPRPKNALAIRCPTRGAAQGEKCEASTGQRRTEPHREEAESVTRKVAVRRLR
jgi:hypothetical protein